MRYQQLIEFKLDKTIAAYGEKLVAAMRKHDQLAANKGWDDPERIMQTMMYMDPTDGKNNMYTLWLVRQYIKGNFRLEDSGRVAKALETFHQLKPRLPVEHRDINRFDRHSLEKLIDNIMGVGTDGDDSIIPGMFPKGRHEDGGSVYDVLYSGPLGLLVIPETQEAACEFGRGTKWCTTGEDGFENMFDEYSDEGPLYIWKDKTGKYQFHFTTLQFMDARDMEIEPSQIEDWRNNHPVLSKLFKTEEDDIFGDGEFMHAYLLKVKSAMPDAWDWMISAKLKYTDANLGVILSFLSAYDDNYGSWSPGPAWKTSPDNMKNRIEKTLTLPRSENVEKILEHYLLDAGGNRESSLRRVYTHSKELFSYVLMTKKRWPELEKWLEENGHTYDAITGEVWHAQLADKYEALFNIELKKSNDEFKLKDPGLF